MLTASLVKAGKRPDKRITEQWCACRYLHRRLAREGDGMIGAGEDRAILRGLGDMDGFDVKTFDAELVGQTQTEPARRPPMRTTWRTVVSLYGGNGA